jgi:uncharacterized protein (DUF1501 family)
MAKRRTDQSQGSGVSRRDFLRVGSLSMVSMSMAEKARLQADEDPLARKNCILIMMTGGPSQLETFDPKPDAPSGIRGPMKAISSSVPGTIVSEGLPKLAQRADQFSLIRSIYHDAAPIHETGFQLLQTGRLSTGGVKQPSFGSVIARKFRPRGEMPTNVVLPRLLGETGVTAYRGQEAGFLGEEFEPATATSAEEETASLSVENEPEQIKQQYGNHRFGQLCLQARQLVENGVRCVTVNLFDSLAGEITFDTHGHKSDSPGTVFDYRDILCPQFDQAVSALLDDLQQRGLLDDTLVLATGEFGRTPTINASSGRDHWTKAWSGLIAGGGIAGGQVIGATDSTASAPIDRPIHLAELTATVYQAMGLNPDSILAAGDGAELALCDHAAVDELLA